MTQTMNIKAERVRAGLCLIASTVIVVAGIAMCRFAEYSTRRLNLPTGGIFNETPEGTSVAIHHANDDMLRKYRKDLEKLGDINTLFLDGSDVTDDAIPELWGLTTLRMLGLSRTKITGVGVRHLAGIKNLDCLQLDETSITDDDVMLLADISKLEYVNLSNTRITDAGLRSLVCVRSLKVVDLFNTAVTEAGVRSLEKERPELQVSYGKFSDSP